MKRIGYAGTIGLMAAMLVATPATAWPWSAVAKLILSDGVVEAKCGATTSPLTLKPPRFVSRTLESIGG
ncbi:MAG: hypothetical protein D6706_21270 [Chloroflexi bacterium]|nr:MAG: hypothetical protein D6706_21270 [Chloroflexota bacterium]